MQTLFIHRSVGRNLIADGHIYRLVREAGASFNLSDYDQNTHLLQNAQGTRQINWKLPGNNTKPSDFAELFSFEKQQANDPTLLEILQYNIVIIKSCYPNSNLKSKEELALVQAAYQKIANFFEVQKSKKLIILTTPPLIPFKTNSENAARARQLATWLAGGTLARNVYVFDLFDQLAAAPNEKEAHMLRKEFRRWLPFDAHPNAKASEIIAPKFVDFLQTVAASE